MKYTRRYDSICEESPHAQKTRRCLDRKCRANGALAGDRETTVFCHLFLSTQDGWAHAFFIHRVLNVLESSMCVPTFHGSAMPPMRGNAP